MCVSWVTGMGTAMDPHGFMRILCGFLNRCEIQQKRFRHGVNVAIIVYV